MKKIILSILVFLNFTISAQNNLSINPINVDVDNNFSLEILLTNIEAVSAFQFDINYNPDAFDLTENHLFNQERSENHELSVNKIGNNKLRVLVYSSNNSVIEIGSGTIVTLNFLSKNEPGSYNIELTNTVLSDANGVELNKTLTNAEIKILGPKFYLETSNLSLGNIPLNSNSTHNIWIYNNGNENLEITSINLQEPLSTDNSLPINLSAGSGKKISINLDTNNKLEVNQIISFETNDMDVQRALQSVNFSANIYAENQLNLLSATAQINTPFFIATEINNMEDFNAFQLDIEIPNGMDYIENSLNFLGREEDHIIEGSLINMNTLRVIAYSPTNKNFNERTGEVFKFSINPNNSAGYFPINISNVILANITDDNIISGFNSGSVFVDAPNLSFSNNTINFGRIPINYEDSKEIFLSNNGGANLIIEDVIYTSDVISSNIEVPLNLSVNQSKSVSINFKALEVGPKEGAIILKHNGTSERDSINFTANVYSPNYLFINDTILPKGDNQFIKLNILNFDEIRAIQFDINIPNGFDFNYQETILKDVIKDFTVQSSDLGNNNFRFLIYNMVNQKINQGTNALLNLPIDVKNSISEGTYKFELSNIILSNTSNNNVFSGALEVGEIVVTSSLSTIAVNIENINSYPNPFKDSYIINSIYPLKLEVFDITGKNILNLNLNEGKNKIDTSKLTKGLYLFKYSYNKQNKKEILIKN